MAAWQRLIKMTSNYSGRSVWLILLIITKLNHVGSQKDSFPAFWGTQLYFLGVLYQCVLQLGRYAKHPLTLHQRIEHLHSGNAFVNGAVPRVIGYVCTRRCAASPVQDEYRKSRNWAVRCSTWSIGPSGTRTHLFFQQFYPHFLVVTDDFEQLSSLPVNGVDQSVAVLCHHRLVHGCSFL